MSDSGLLFFFGQCLCFLFSLQQAAHEEKPKQGMESVTMAQKGLPNTGGFRLHCAGGPDQFGLSLTEPGGFSHLLLCMLQNVLIS